MIKKPARQHNGKVYESNFTPIENLVLPCGFSFQTPIFACHNSFLGSGPKGQVSCSTWGNFQTSVLPSVLTSVLPSYCPSFRPSIPPCWLSRPKICPPSPQFSPLGLKSAFQALNQPSRLQISPPPASILPSNLQICLLWPKSVI